jgi:geranylgeranyl diphosphate synthase type II
VEIKNILGEYSLQTNKTLEELLNIETPLSGTLLLAMKYSLFSGGKRLRPALTRMVAEMVGGDLNAALIVGAAIEMIHTYSLIHDDLPSMDNDDYRRGKLTNHKVYGEGIAILAGDGLLTYAFHVLSRIPLPPENTLKIIEVVSGGAGLEGMVAGQVLDLEGENRDLKLEELKAIHRAKTGALFKSSILAGAFCGSPSLEELKSLEEFSEYLGITFQIVDDILDVIGDEEKLGKRVGSDEKLNKATYPRLLGLEGARKEARIAGQKAKKALGIFGAKARRLEELVDYIIIRQS